MNRSFKPIMYILALALALCPLSGCATEDAGYADRDVRCSLAGSGDPWGALTRSRLRMMLALHDGQGLEQLAAEFEMTEDELQKELDPLVEVSLVRRDEGVHRPAVFIANREEVERVYSFSGELGIALADAIIAEWESLDHAFARLSIAEGQTLREQGFLLVGSRILDIGMINLLYEDASLMTEPPHRPSPERPDARYYFWILETDRHEHLGKYGEDDTDLKWENRHLLDFGQTVVAGDINKARRDFQERAALLVESDRIGEPLELATKLGIPSFDAVDSRIWQDVAGEVSRRLLPVILDDSNEIRNFYATLQAAEYTNNSFGEFFCCELQLVNLSCRHIGNRYGCSDSQN